MDLDLIGGSYKGYSTAVNARRCINLLPVVDKDGGKPLSVQGTPGLKELGRFGAATKEDIDSDYTEVDAGGLVTLTDYTCTGASLLRASTTHVYKDHTAAYFAANFVHKCGVKAVAFGPETISDAAMVEVDTSSKVTKSDTAVTATAIDRTHTAYVYEDFGVDYFSGDFEHRFSFRSTVFPASSERGSGMFISFWMLANDIATITGLPTEDSSTYGKALTLSLTCPYNSSTLNLWLETRDGENKRSSAITGLAVGTIYYCKVVRNEAVGDEGTLYAYVYSDANFSTLVGSASIALYSKLDFRYLYTFNKTVHGTNDQAVTGYGQYYTYEDDSLQIYPWLMSNTTNKSATEHAAVDYLGVYLEKHCSNINAYVVESVAGTLQTATVATGLTANTQYYLKVERDESIGDAGRLYASIYTDSAYTVQFGSGYVDLTDKENFQYLYLFNKTVQTVGKQTASVTTSNYLLGGATSLLPVRGMSNKIGDYIYAAIGGDIVRVTSAGVMVDKGNLDTSTGPVYFCDNGAKILFVDGTAGYTIVTDTFAKISDGDFPTPSSCAYQDGYFMVSKASSGDWYLSDLDDPTAWNPLNVAALEGIGDNLSRIMSDGRMVWLFGEKSFEIDYNSGAEFPFDRIEGTRRKVGVGAAASVAEEGGVFFWFTDERRAVMTEGYVPKVISSPQIEYLWGNYTTVSDAIGFARTQEGHVLYTLTFPTEDVTWEFDATTNMWHELQSAEDKRWRANCYVYAFSKHLVGDYMSSIIYEVDTDTYTDNGYVVKRSLISGEHEVQGKRWFIPGIEVTGETGTANENAPGDDPQVSLSWSKDRGRTFTTPVDVDWGTYESYSNRAMFRRIGSSRSWIFRVDFEDQVKVVITGARFLPDPIMGET